MRGYLITTLLVLILGFVAWKVLTGFRALPEMTQRVYVWQRVQDSPEVVVAIESIPVEIVSGLLPLVAEIHFRNGPDQAPDVVRPILAGGALSQRDEKGFSDAAVIRIGTSAKDTGWDESACQLIEKLVRDLLQTSEWTAAELQLDYDCPQKRLKDYAKLLRHLQNSFPEKRITFTALPSWLEEGGFRNLASVADSFVLQVHSLQIPKDPTSEVILIDEESARTAVEKAAAIGRPFEVALPTYSCFVMFSAEGGQVVDVVSEDLPEQWPVSVGRIRLGQTDPAAMVRLMEGWRESRPPEMTGVIWYRLPVASDEMNWSPEVWMKVVWGEVPKAKLELSVEVSESAEEVRSDLVLTNTGEVSMTLPKVIDLQISGSGSYRFDGSQLYEGKGDPLKFHLVNSRADLLPLPAGESIAVGWIEGKVKVVAAMETAKKK